MAVFEHERILPCGPDDAWEAVIDFPSRTIHGPRYRRAELPDGKEPAPGHRILLQIGRDRFTSVVTVAEKPAALSHRAAGPGFWAEYSYALRVCNDGDFGYTSEDLGCAHLKIRGEYGGWLGSVIAKLRPGACRRYLADEMAAVVSAAESVRAEPVNDDHSDNENIDSDGG